MANGEPLPSVFKCCLCQMKTDEDLESPHAQRQQENDACNMIVFNIPLFHAINEMPIVLDPSRLDDCGWIEETLRTNHQFKVVALCSTTM